MIKKKKDEYLVYTNPRNSADYYYKNKLLHREDGPAIVIDEDKEQYSNLSDKKRYKRVTEPVVEDEIFTFSTMDYNGNVKTFQKYRDQSESSYYLDDVEYDKEEFYAIVLEEELKSNNKKVPTKKLKV